MTYVIERRADLLYEEFAAGYLYPNKPVIVTDAIRSWRALSCWTPEFFKQEFGGMKFTRYGAEYEGDTYEKADDKEFTMSELVDRVLESTEERPAPYFRNKILTDIFPSLRRDIEPLPEYLRPNWLGERYMVKHVQRILNRGAAIELFIGGNGSTFPFLHYDGAGAHAFLMQVYGRKEFIVYPPEQEQFLYPSPEQKNHSLIRNVDYPDLNKFPLFARALPTKFILEPGEMLFVPSHWWHTTRILTPCITLAVNVLNQSNWHELMKYVSLRRRNPFVSLASRAYLTGAGAWRSWRDREWRKRVQRRSA